MRYILSRHLDQMLRTISGITTIGGKRNCEVNDHTFWAGGWIHHVRFLYHLSYYRLREVKLASDGRDTIKHSPLNAARP
jgi:hypothetical protein